MTSEDFASLELSRYELTLEARQKVLLPQFLGSTLRGAFGHALKQAVCVMHHRQCERCMVADRCIYPYLFETPVPKDVPQLRGQTHAPHPFILSPPMLKVLNRAEKVKAGPSQQRINAQMLSDGRKVRLIHSPVVDETNARRPLADGGELTFGLLLMGRAVEYLPYVIYAMNEMARHGLGVERARFELVQVSMVDETGANHRIYSGKLQRISISEQPVRSLAELTRLRMDSLMQSSTFNPHRLKLKFLTPTRIRAGGDLQAELSFELLVRNLLRRLSLLAAVHGTSRLELDYRKLIEAAASVETRASDLHWHDWERYSNRQREKMSLGGFVGAVEYAGEAVKQLLPLIIAGEILHVGTGTSFGLGKYEVAI